MKTRVISVDLWGTIFDFHTEISSSVRRRQLIREYAARLGCSDDVALDEAYLEASRHFGDTYRDSSVTLTPKERIEYQLSLVGLRPDGNGFEKLVTDVENAILESPPPLPPNVKDGLQTLADRFPLVIVSDTGFSPGSAIREIFKRYDIAQFFGHHSFSNETGVSKPHPDAFMTVLRRLNCGPSEMLHIGDTEWTDIRGASEIGARTCLYVGLNDEHLGATKADFILHDWNDAGKLIEQVVA